MDQIAREPPETLLDGSALFLDFDGTLVELAETPDAVRVAGDLPSLLRDLSKRLGGRIAIISGRSIDDLERHLDCSGTAVAGSHGHELRFADGTRVPVAVPDGLDWAIGKARRFAGQSSGLLVEVKPAGLAIHFRQVPHLGEQVESFMTELADITDLSLQRGKMLIELRPRGSDKGQALRTFMAEPPFSDARPLFVGDDLTDEDGFKAAAALGGDGILVGPPRPTAAKWRLQDVGAVARWLGGSGQIDA